MERKLATIQQIKELRPIEGADLIELAIINGWQVVVKKGEHKVDELIIYCEIDSFLPIREEFEFLRKSSFKRMGDQEGFRLKTIKLKGQVSQGLILPLSVLKGKIYDQSYKGLSVGDEVTEALGIVKWEPPIPAQLAGIIKGNFPVFIPKTDEERIQNLSSMYENLKKNKYYVTEKLDGSSATFYHNNGEFGVCSRNIDLLESEDNSFWKVVNAMNLKEVLPKFGNIALQGELVGEGIQGNPYKLNGQRVYFFNAWDIDKQHYLSFGGFVLLMTQVIELVTQNCLYTVPFINSSFTLPDTIEELLTIAEGKSKLNDKTEREGLVIRSLDRNISFKVISNRWLLKCEQ